MAAGVEFKLPEDYQIQVLKRVARPELLPDEQRVVVTGLGTVNPVGSSVPETWKNILEGRSGIALISDEERRDSRVQIAGEIKEFKPEMYFEPRETKWVHRSAQIFTAAATEALIDAGLWDPRQVLGKQPLRGVHPYDIGINCGSGTGGTNYFAVAQDIFRERGDRKIPPTSVMQTLIDRIASVTGMNRFIKGPTYTVTAACASSGYAEADAHNAIRNGDALVMVTGGSDSAIDRITIGAFAAIRALSTSHNHEPENASRPFDKNADGFVEAEGAAANVLERLDYAKARGAKIYAELVGYGNTADAEHDTAPSGEGAIRAMQMALARAGIPPEEIGYINAHATSTPIGDPPEVRAIRYVFGEYTPRIPISATKSMTGHMLGATGALEAIFAILAMRDGMIPPTINLDNPIDDELDFVPYKAKSHAVEYAITNTFGFGGMNNSLVFRKWVS